MLSSGAMWGLMVGQIAHDWALFMINADLPKYMKTVMKFSIAEVRKPHILLRSSTIQNWDLTVLFGRKM